MTSTSTLSLVAAWFVLGQARIVFTSKMVEHRIDGPDPSQAMAFTRAPTRPLRSSALRPAYSRASANECFAHCVLGGENTEPALALVQIESYCIHGMVKLDVAALERAYSQE